MVKIKELTQNEFCIIENGSEDVYKSCTVPMD